ncbi:substrate-binding periplasmic protein [Actinomadura welshii]|uniref:substrate-binding periplasmic protein n=1 Tax=Actinomadura welshii TaxID=3103817 RepID=UPI0003AD0927|nr:transporter substrate-binding domain-containing protein [Actinomadura madurae]
MGGKTAFAMGAILAAATLGACGIGSANEAGPKAGCTPSHSGLKTVRPGALTVATYNFPPFLQVQGSTVSGVEGDILKKIADLECLTLASQPLDTGSVIPATQNGRTDVSAGDWYCTGARAKVLSLAGPVYGDQIVIVSSDGATTFDDLKGRSVGTVDGYLWNKELAEIYGSSLKVYPNPTAVYSDLEVGRLDAAIDSIGTASYAKKQNGESWHIERPEPDPRVASSQVPGQVCFPMSRSNPNLFKAVSEDIVELRRNGGIAQVLTKYGLDPAAADPGPLRLIG